MSGGSSRHSLETTLRHFTTLSVGDVIPVHYNDTVFEIEIVELRPADAVVVIETDMEVEFFVPPEMLRPAPTPVPEPPEPERQPWLDALPHGVRTRSVAFSQLIREGRVAGVVGARDQSNSSVFQGKGRSLE